MIDLNLYVDYTPELESSVRNGDLAKVHHLSIALSLFTEDGDRVWILHPCTYIIADGS